MGEVLKRIPRPLVVLALLCVLYAEVFYWYCCSYDDELAFSEIWPISGETVELFALYGEGEERVTVDLDMAAYEELTSLLAGCAYQRVGEISGLPDRYVSLVIGTRHGATRMMISREHLLICDGRHSRYVFASGEEEVHRYLSTLLEENGAGKEEPAPRKVNERLTAL